MGRTTVRRMERVQLPSLPPCVRLVEGRGGLPCLQVEHPVGQGEFYLDGATLTGWRPDGHAPVLWLSPHSRFAAGEPIRGGVPLCFPWFASGAAGDRNPSHGFARIRRWDVLGVQADDEGVRIRARLTDDEVTRALWPHKFEAVYQVHLGRSLGLELSVQNTGTESFAFEEALHTYLAVGDVAGVLVNGLEGTPFVDKLDPLRAERAEAAPIRIAGSIDRLYHANAEPVQVVDAARTLTLAKTGSETTVVWNPWSEGSDRMADLGADDWPWFVCVETANTGPDAVTLESGQEHRMRATIGVR